MNEAEMFAELDEALRRINEERVAMGLLPGGPVPLCQICLEISEASVCPRCETHGGLYDDWRSDCDG